MKMTDESCENLINAIIKTAVDDYRRGFRKLLSGKQLTYGERRNMDESELFFNHSNMFDLYPNVTGEYLMNTIINQERELAKGT